MINIYDITQDQEYKPFLRCINSIDIDSETQFDDERTVELLRKYLYLNEFIAEHVYVVGYNLNHSIAGIYCLGIGDYNSCDVYNRNIAIFLLLSGSVYFRLFHNHPNDLLQTSDSDKASATQLEILGRLLEIEFKGSYILARNTWKNIDDDDPFGELYLEKR